jgi:prepilin-type N-terminal cleavage/methylation domain-containing protein
MCFIRVRPTRVEHRRRGFTLIEASLVTSIIGIGVVAMLQLLAAGTVSNGDGAEATTAMNLAKNIRELAMGLKFADPSLTYKWDPNNPVKFGLEPGETLQTCDDMDDLDGQVICPPIDARRMSLDANLYSDWEQHVSVCSVDPDHLTNDKVGNGTSPALRLTVSVYHHKRCVCSLSWLAFDTSE